MRFFTGLLIVLMMAGAANAEEIKIVTENWPPYQIVEGGKVVDGFAVDIVRQLLKETRVNAKIKSYPWARAYSMAQEEENVLIFSITRTKERESLFKWVGSIIGSEADLWSLKERSDIAIDSLEDAKKYKTGVPRDDLQHQFLKEKGFEDEKHLHLLVNRDQAIKMLYAKRIDLIMGAELPVVYGIKKLNLDPLKLNKAYKIGQQWGDLAIAFSKSTSDSVVTKFQQALEKMKKEGVYDKLLSKWQTGNP